VRYLQGFLNLGPHHALTMTPIIRPTFPTKTKVHEDRGRGRGGGGVASESVERERSEMRRLCNVESIHRER